jgi:quercetin dioxygenase-like cupin family protein
VTRTAAVSPSGWAAVEQARSTLVTSLSRLSCSATAGEATMGDKPAHSSTKPGESELRWMGETSTSFLATGEQTGGAFCLVDEQASRGESVPLHRHRDDMESFDVLEGELTLYIGDRPAVCAPAGSFAHVPGGTVHGFRDESDKARYLILTTPRHGEFYRAMPPRVATGRPAAARFGPRIADQARDQGVWRRVRRTAARSNRLAAEAQHPRLSTMVASVGSRRRRGAGRPRGRQRRSG